MNRREFVTGMASLAATGAFAGGTGGGAREKVLFDTDIGVDIDDSFALGYLLSEPRCDLLGITTVGGHPELRAEMASAFCTAFGKPDIPIHPGCGRTLIYPREPLNPTSARQLGKLPRRTFTDDGSAVPFLRQTIRANPGEITLVAVAPYTNVATLFLSDPEIPGLLKRMVVMGGDYFSQKPDSEWNMMCDPEATVVTFGPGGCTRVPETFFHGLDVTTKTNRKPPELIALSRELKPLNFMTGIVEFFFETHPYYAKLGKSLHDPLACLCLFHPEVCTYRRGTVKYTLGGDDQGYSRFAEDPKGHHRVADSVDVAKFYEIYRQTVSAAG